jgi:hypothetical protein
MYISDLSSYHSSQVRKCLTIKSLRPAKGGIFTFYVQIHRLLFGESIAKKLEKHYEMALMVL